MNEKRRYPCSNPLHFSRTEQTSLPLLKIRRRRNLLVRESMLASLTPRQVVGNVDNPPVLVGHNSVVQN